MKPPRWTEPPRNTTRPIIAAVCSAAGIDFGDLIAARNRMPEVVQARRAAVYLLREMTGISYPRIAVLLGRSPGGHSSMHERYTAASWLVKRGDVEFINLLDASREALGKQHRFRAMVARVTNQLAQEHHRGEEVLHRVPGRQLPTHTQPARDHHQE